METKYTVYQPGYGLPSLTIVYEDNHLLACVKPVGILSQEDNTGKPDMLTLLKQYLKETYNKPGNVWLSLLHRLDQPVGGLMLFAKTSKAASRLSEQIRQKHWQKFYLAVTHGVPEANCGNWQDYISTAKQAGKFCVVKKPCLPTKQQAKTKALAKRCELNYACLKTITYAEEQLSLLKIELVTGRRHQIRVQTSNRNLPLVGDRLYGEQKSKLDHQSLGPALYAYELGFTHPISKEKMVLQAPMPNALPFNLFA